MILLPPEKSSVACDSGFSARPFPRPHLFITVVIATSFARIQSRNLISQDNLPLVFANGADYEKFKLGDEREIEDVRRAGGTLEHLRDEDQGTP